MCTPVYTESSLGYQPSNIKILTLTLNQGNGHCQLGSLTGAVASQKVTEAFKGSLRMDGNHSQSTKAKASLTARDTAQAE